MLAARAEAVEQLQNQFNEAVQQQAFFLRAREIHITLENYDLWFDLSTPIAEQLRRYRVLLENINPGDITQYVDLRISDRVIYR